MKYIKIIYLILIIAFISLTGCEDNNNTVFDHNASLEGYVTFEDATPDTLFANITISRNNISLGNTITDTTGYYFFDELATGEYYISIDQDGYARSSLFIELFSNETVTADTVMLMAMSTMEYFTPVIDGEIDASWSPVYTDDYSSGWGGNDFSELYLAYDDEYLYIAVTGEFSTGDNTVSICIDKDGSGDTGINDFREVSGGEIGDHIRKNIDAPDDFGADVAINSGWGLSGEAVVSLENPSAVDQALFENINISMNGSVLEIAISLEEIYGGVTPSMISLVGYIGGGGDQYFDTDVIPLGAGDFEGTFYEVFTIGF